MIIWLKRVAVAAVLLIALGASAFMCTRVAARGRFATACSTLSAGPAGTRGLFSLAERDRLSPVRLTQDFGALPRTGMLVALSAPNAIESRKPTAAEKRLLRRFVEGGGTLVVAGPVDYLPEDLGLQIHAYAEAGPGSGAQTDTASAAPSTAPAELVLGRSTSPLFDGLGAAGFRQPQAITFTASTAPVILFNSDAGPLAVSLQVGRGTVIALASASIFQNRDLVEADGAPLFARIAHQYAPQGPVYFDEYHLGVGERRSYVKYLSDFGLGAVVAQLLVIALFAFMRAAARMGSPVSPLATPPAGTASYVAAIGALYGSSKDGAAALRVLVRDAIRRIARHHALPTQHGAGALVSALEQARLTSAANGARALVALENAAPTANLTQLARQIDHAVHMATTDQVQTKG